MRKALLSVTLGLASISGSALRADEGHLHAHAEEKLGTVSFPTSCASADQKPFERGVALLHSFWYDEAYKQFQQVADQDPQCAIAYWGEALSLFHQLWARPEESDLKEGWDRVGKAQAVGAKTQRERDYIDALAVFYRDYDKLDHEQRCMGYSLAMEKVYRRYPQDHEAAVFYALSLLTWAPDANTGVG